MLAAADAPPAVPPQQPVAYVWSAQVVRRIPLADARAIARLSPRRPITGGPTIVPVLERWRAPGGQRWLRVRVPGRPNGRRGWIRAERTSALRSRWHIVVDLGARRAYVFRAARLLRRYRVVVGHPRTPTPTGRFFVEENVRERRGRPGGPFALALSARSNVLQEFAGGPGQVALHGTTGLPGRLGTAVSHGCVRFGPRAIAWIARRVGAGVPVTIRR
jgi:lipoprotein-anchoring transpeptidase ErfK/SrfK